MNSEDQVSWLRSGKSPVSNEQIRENVKSSMKRGLPEPGRGKGAVHLVGGGPSLDPRKLRDKKWLCAINQAHDHLLEHNVTPHWCTLVDPVPEVADLITPNPRVTYFVASQCDPKVFNKLWGHNVRIFHLDNGVSLDDLVESPLRVRGGPSTILRAWALHWHRGHHVFHFWGFDCSGPHAYEQRAGINPFKMNVEIGGKTFTAGRDLLRQAHSFFDQKRYMDQIRPPTVYVHGNGLVATLMRKDVRL